MKNKVIINRNGKIVEKNIELTQFNENIFYYLEDEKYPYLISVVVKHNEIYIDVAYMNINMLESRKDTLNDYAENYKQRVEEKENPFLIDYYVFQKLGYDTSKMDEAKNLFLEKQKQILENKKIREQKEREERFNLMKLKVENLLNDLKSGKNITFNNLEEIINFNDVKIHPRTLGAIRGLGNRNINIEYGEFLKKTSQSTVNSIFQIIKNLINE